MADSVVIVGVRGLVRVKRRKNGHEGQTSENEKNCYGKGFTL